jgi:hypothetical protein
MNVDPIDESHPALVEAGKVAELARLQAELKEYQDLIEEFSGIYESKFNHRLSDVAQDIRALVVERRRLQHQINSFLPEGTRSSSLPSTATTSSFSPIANLRCWLNALTRGQMALAAAAVAVVLSLPVGLLLRAVHSPSDPEPGLSATFETFAPSPGTPARPGKTQLSAGQFQEGSQLQIRANGESWLELRNPDEQLLFQGTLQPGQKLTFELLDGMRIRSGRPHFLEIALADQPFTPLGVANDFRWRKLSLPDHDAGAEPEPSASDQAS